MKKTPDYKPYSKEKFFEAMLLVRKTEELLLALFSKGKLNGTTHTSIGQEACAVGVLEAIDRNRDIVFSSHRCHGHYLVYSDGDVEGLIGEITGKKMGVCGGIGGSQHIHKRNFYSNGVQGGIVPVATGMALAEKHKGTGAVSVCFLGDGTMGQGVVYESLNIASIWSIPILYVIENNEYAQTTPRYLVHAGNFLDRAKAFQIDATELDVEDVENVYQIAKGIIEFIRKNNRPFVLILNTYRFGPHSKGDDHRPLKEINNFKERDPLQKLRTKLDSKIVILIENIVEERIKMAMNNCFQSESISIEQFLQNEMGKNKI